MNLYDSSFLCLDIGDFSVKALAHRIRNGKIIKSALQIIECNDITFAIKSAVDELENQLGVHFESAFITGDFGMAEFKTIAKTSQWQTDHKITTADIQNQIAEISENPDLYPMHIFPLRYDTDSVANLLTPIGRTDKNLLSIFGAIFYDKNKINNMFEALRQAHIQPKSLFDPSFVLNAAFKNNKENGLFIDLGASATTVSVWTGRGPIFFNKDIYGQTNITNEISQKLNININDVYKIKHFVASIIPDEMDRFTPADSNYDFSRADLNDIVINMITDIVYEIQKLTDPVIKKYKPSKIFLSGGGSNITGIAEFLEETFELPVENLGSDATVQALSETIWKSQEKKVKAYLERRNKFQNYLNNIFSIFHKKKPKKRLLPIMPSTLSFDMKNPNTYQLFKSGNISMIHVDIMDGFFVNKIASGISELKFIRSHTNAHLYVHLMTESPNSWAAAAANYGADTIIISTNTAGVRSALTTIKKLGKRCGIALNPETDASILVPVLKDIDDILIMTVQPGAGGGEFDLSILNKISMLANTRDKYNLKYKISVDGGINPSTAKLCWKAGADFLISGTYLATAPDFPIAVQSLLP